MSAALPLNYGLFSEVERGWTEERQHLAPARHLLPFEAAEDYDNVVRRSDPLSVVDLLAAVLAARSGSELVQCFEWSSEAGATLLAVDNLMTSDDGLRRRVLNRITGHERFVEKMLASSSDDRAEEQRKPFLTLAAALWFAFREEHVRLG